MTFSSAIGEFVIGASAIGVSPSPPQPPPVQNPLPVGPSSIQNQIPAYVYQQYADDDVVQAFFEAYNQYAQAYLDYLNNLNLPVYSGGQVSGPLLDWVGTNLYGIPRPGLPTKGVPLMGPLNTYQYNALGFNRYVPAVTQTFTATSDDVYRRIITWAYYKGDGKAFTPRWLKRRIYRFLFGINGTDPTQEDPQDMNTYDISVAWSAPKIATITIAPSTPIAVIFQAAVAAGILELPIQTEWTVVI